MADRLVLNSVVGMERLRNLHWPIIIGLGALALGRPLSRIIMSQASVDTSPAVPILLTLGISATWIVIVGFSRTPRPVLTLVLAGRVYAVAAIALSAVLSPILDGQLSGPLANPIAIVPMLLTTIIWGLVTGVIALGLQRQRTGTPPPTSAHR